MRTFKNPPKITQEEADEVRRIAKESKMSIGLTLGVFVRCCLSNKKFIRDLIKKGQEAHKTRLIEREKKLAVYKRKVYLKKRAECPEK